MIHKHRLVVVIASLLIPLILLSQQPIAVSSNPIHVSTFGESGQNLGQLWSPQGIDMNDTTIIVTSFTSPIASINFFDHSGKYEIAQTLLQPFEIAIGPSNIYIAGFHSNLVYIFNDKTNTMEYIGDGNAGSGDYQVDTPYGVGTNSTHFFVADTGNNRIQIFTHNKEYAGTIGGKVGIGEYEFDFPTDVEVTDTHVYVADNHNSRVQVFDLSGKYVSTIGTTRTTSSEIGQFYYPSKLNFQESNQRLYVTDPSLGRIQYFDINFNYIGYFGSSGTGPGQFSQMTGITSNSTHVLVTDQKQDNVHMFLALPEVNTVTQVSTEINEVTETTTTTISQDITTTETEGITVQTETIEFVTENIPKSTVPFSLTFSIIGIMTVLVFYQIYRKQR